MKFIENTKINGSDCVSDHMAVILENFIQFRWKFKPRQCRINYDEDNDDDNEIKHWEHTQWFILGSETFGIGYMSFWKN